VHKHVVTLSMYGAIFVDVSTSKFAVFVAGV